MPTVVTQEASSAPAASQRAAAPLSPQMWAAHATTVATCQYFRQKIIRKGSRRNQSYKIKNRYRRTKFYHAGASTVSLSAVPCWTSPSVHLFICPALSLFRQVFVQDVFVLFHLLRPSSPNTTQKVTYILARNRSILTDQFFVTYQPRGLFPLQI